jgi:hypothetical protein
MRRVVLEEDKNVTDRREGPLASHAGTMRRDPHSSGGAAGASSVKANFLRVRPDLRVADERSLPGDRSVLVREQRPLVCHAAGLPHHQRPLRANEGRWLVKALPRRLRLDLPVGDERRLPGDKKLLIREERPLARHAGGLPHDQRPLGANEGRWLVKALPRRVRLDSPVGDERSLPRDQSVLVREELPFAAYTGGLPRHRYDLTGKGGGLLGRAGSLQVRVGSVRVRLDGLFADEGRLSCDKSPFVWEEGLSRRWGPGLAGDQRRTRRQKCSFPCDPSVLDRLTRSSSAMLPCLRAEMRALLVWLRVSESNDGFLRSRSRRHHRGSGFALLRPHWQWKFTHPLKQP